MNKQVFEIALEKALKQSKKRNFDQSVELAINFKGLDFKKPVNRVEVELTLPTPVEKPVKTIVFVQDKGFASELKGSVDRIVLEDEVSKLSKKDARKLAREFTIFLAEGAVMVAVGKYLGQILSPQGKMPKPVPANIKAVQVMINSLKNISKVSNKKGKFMPVVHVLIGKQSMELAKLAVNGAAVYAAVEGKLAGGKQNIKSVFVKTTMGPSIEVKEEESGKK
ncbi:MAG: 50S ribosomal protein L1 [archaeon]